MKNYFENLHKKPHHHKRRFALLVSGSVTLVIFTFWSLATFGALSSGTKIAETPKESVSEPGPFAFIGSNLASSFSALQDEWSKLGSMLNSVDLESEYKEMREKALDTYGQ